ncbi:hypothetical protein Y788_16775 [Pantoea dispersa 625]|nr:hypothetical protein Y788_16775 [Pantoea dispersa 625]
MVLHQLKKTITAACYLTWVIGFEIYLAPLMFFPRETR